MPLLEPTWIAELAMLGDPVTAASMMPIHQTLLELDQCILAIRALGDQGFDLTTGVGGPGTQPGGA
ncbi:MAG: hypothetical protein EOM91_09460 [Sphingobacteriia bacterium]|nr:hypothetical protein [Sphingobacteriia bacterium]NCC39938.1 hypothetical protein [Gammaproteobacteria bacterium]